MEHPELLNAPPRIPTGLKALDVALKGGFVRRAMYVLAGLTGPREESPLRCIGTSIGDGWRACLVAHA